MPSKACVCYENDGKDLDGFDITIPRQLAYSLTAYDRFIPLTSVRVEFATVIRNQRVAENIARALALKNGPAGKPTTMNATEPQERLNTARPIVDRIYAGEKLWSLRVIAERHGIGYWTVYRELQGKPGFLTIGRRQIRVTDSLYKSWIQSWVLGIPLAS
jgi:hypothetical protein